MSDVIHVRFSTPAERRASRLGTLLQVFAHERRSDTDVFWLKENGELLNVLESSGTQVPARFLELHAQTYDGIADRLAFFPQYYRFILSIALDLEDLGLPGNRAEELCDWAHRNALAEGETSDIQRLEARRLLARRGLTACAGDTGLEDRLRAFIADPARFALPNKKAAYELTHILFYLSEYGRRDPQVSEQTRKSLENVGIWAFLDGNCDLLAEICIAMRYAGFNPAEIWEEWISRKMSETQVLQGALTPRGDGYHTVFMGAWLATLRGAEAFGDLALPQAGQGAGQGAGHGLVFEAPRRTGALGEMSRRLYDLGAQRSGDWTAMRPMLDETLSDEAQAMLSTAEASCPGFADFFECFARPQIGAQATAQASALAGGRA